MKKKSGMEKWTKSLQPVTIIQNHISNIFLFIPEQLSLLKYYYNVVW